jgi:1,4-dihydroxy-2-naphthoate octaprenyltransferase
MSNERDGDEIMSRKSRRRLAIAILTVIVLAILVLFTFALIAAPGPMLVLLGTLIALVGGAWSLEELL